MLTRIWLFSLTAVIMTWLFAAGATHTLTRRLQDWWLTAVGEVPAQTLRAFAQHLERRR